jgi:hypothetical protein
MVEDYSVPLNTSGGAGYVPRDYNSSSSSIASSYETATSTIELQGESNGVLWSRPVRRIGSGGSLSAYDTTPPLRPQPTHGGGRVGLAPSVSDNSIASRPLRTESMGSASDNSGAYPDAWNQNPQTASTGGWIEASSSYEQGRRVRNPQLHRGGERKMPQDSGERMQGSMRGRDLRRPSSGETHDDGGLSMMTSALLNMLDTPEEAALKSYTSGETQSKMNPISPPTTPRSGHTGYAQERESYLPLEDRYLGSSAIGQEQYHARGGSDLQASRYGHEQYHARGVSDLQASRYDFTSNEYAHGFVSEHGNVIASNSAVSPARMSREEYSREHPSLRQSRSSPSWSPTWQGPTPDGNPEQTNQSMLAMQHPSKATESPHPSKAHASSNIGLYLP